MIGYHCKQLERASLWCKPEFTGGRNARTNMSFQSCNFFHSFHTTALSKRNQGEKREKKMKDRQTQPYLGSGPEYKQLAPGADSSATSPLTLALMASPCSRCPGTPIHARIKKCFLAFTRGPFFTAYGFYLAANEPSVVTSSQPHLPVATPRHHEADSPQVTRIIERRGYLTTIGCRLRWCQRF